jgi:hypothetical protein
MQHLQHEQQWENLLQITDNWRDISKQLYDATLKIPDRDHKIDTHMKLADEPQVVIPLG